MSTLLYQWSQRTVFFALKKLCQLFFLVIMTNVLERTRMFTLRHFGSRAWTQVYTPRDYCWSISSVVRALGCLRVRSILDDYVWFLVDKLWHDLVTSLRVNNIPSIPWSKNASTGKLFDNSLVIDLMFESTRPDLNVSNLVHFNLICNEWRFFILILLIPVIINRGVLFYFGVSAS